MPRRLSAWSSDASGVSMARVRGGRGAPRSMNWSPRSSARTRPTPTPAPPWTGCGPPFPTGRASPAPLVQIAAAIRPAGLHRQKARSIRAILRRLRGERGRLDLGFLRRWPTARIPHLPPWPARRRPEDRRLRPPLQPAAADPAGRHARPPPQPPLGSHRAARHRRAGPRGPGGQGAAGLRLRLSRPPHRARPQGLPCPAARLRRVRLGQGLPLGDALPVTEPREPSVFACIGRRMTL